MKLSRRAFIVSSLSSTLGAVISLKSGGKLEAKMQEKTHQSRPNILFIESDQHSPHVLGCAGDKVIRTPNLDGLADRGVMFTNNYCSNPLCVPSRMAMLTSRHSSDIEVWTNQCILSSELPTFVHGLGAAGYETILCGRMHFRGPDCRHGFHTRIIGDPDITGIKATGQHRSVVDFAGPGHTVYMAYDDAVTETCCEFLKKRAQAKNRAPFFTTVGYVLPHCPYICPKDLFDEYFDQVDVPRVSRDYLAKLHPAVKDWKHNRRIDPGELTDDQIRTARAAYYGLVTYMDQNIGQILQTLEDTGLAENTIVIYISDHGEMAGEHEMWWKSNFYEGSVRVPLIISWPGHFAEGRRIDQLTSLLDIGPTLLDLVGGDPLPFAAGRSMAGFLAGLGSVQDWSNQVLAEYTSILFRGDAPGFMVRRDQWKLNYYHGFDTPQLFNIEKDSEEMNDLGSNPSYSSIREELLEVVRSNWSGEKVVEAMKRKAKQMSYVNNWQKKSPSKYNVRSPWNTAERWKAPPASNVYPKD